MKPENVRVDNEYAINLDEVTSVEDFLIQFAVIAEQIKQNKEKFFAFKVAGGEDFPQLCIETWKVRKVSR